MAFSPVNVVILYASQTGTAKEVAEQVGRMATARLMSKVVMEMDAFPIDELPEQSFVIFVVSSTGDGEVPTNMQNIWKFLLKRNLPNDALEDMNFAVFGLGDSSYAKFNAAARRLQKRLLQLGGKEFIPIGLGDDQHELGYFGELDPWIKDVWASLEQHFPLPGGYVPDDSPKLLPAKFTVTFHSDGVAKGENEVHNSSFYAPPKHAYHAEKGPILAKLCQNKRITAPEWQQDVRHVELELPQDSQIQYKPGDIVWIYPQNTGDIDGFIHRLGFDPASIISISANTSELKDALPSPLSVRDLFTRYLDILGTPRRYFFEQLSLFATNEEECEKLLEMASAEGADLLHDYCTREKRTYIEIFSDFKSCSPPLERILEIIPRLQPRAFSISSSALAYPGKIHLSVAIVNFFTPYKRQRSGVLTSWLTTLDPCKDDIFIPLWVASGLITFPTDSSTKLVLIGPGTGVAPMRSIIQERRHLEHVGGERPKPSAECSMTLYFGCRHAAKDFLYREEFEKYQHENILDLHTAFSRDQEYKIYVQGRLAENKETIFQLLMEEGAYFVIAGSAKRMPSDVYETLRDILRSEGKFSLVEADKLMKRLIKQKRYLVEAWS